MVTTVHSLLVVLPKLNEMNPSALESNVGYMSVKIVKKMVAEKLSSDIEMSDI